jgi:DNA-binding XRE family transcriptional regulator
MLETTLRRPTVVTAYKVASAFGLSIEQVFPKEEILRAE